MRLWLQAEALFLGCGTLRDRPFAFLELPQRQPFSQYAHLAAVIRLFRESPSGESDIGFKWPHIWAISTYSTHRESNIHTFNRSFQSWMILVPEFPSQVITWTDFGEICMCLEVDGFRCSAAKLQVVGIGSAHDWPVPLVYNWSSLYVLSFRVPPILDFCGFSIACRYVSFTPFPRAEHCVG